MQQESKENQKLYTLFTLIGFIIVVFDVLFYGHIIPHADNLSFRFLSGFAKIAFFKSAAATKISTMVILTLVGIGTVARKKPNMDIIKYVVIPLTLGLIMMFCSLPIQLMIGEDPSTIVFHGWTFTQIVYSIASMLGAVLYVLSIGNITKIVRTNLGKDVWNIEGESFMQESKKLETDTSINIPTIFYHKDFNHDGWINLDPFRGTVVIGVPGCGKSFGIILPIIRQMIEKNFTMCIYDFKYPDLANVAYYRYLVQNNKYDFKVLNLDNVEQSIRVNPLDRKYITSLADAQETASCIVESLQKSDSSSGGEVFFKESAVDLLAAAIYFLSKYENGKFSDIPHLISLITADYDIIFEILGADPELTELLSTFLSSYKRKAFDQLEGQAATLRVFLSKLATKQSYYLFGKEETNLDLSNPDKPSILILASNPQTQNINSTLYALVLNRITKQVNDKGNLPFGLVVDEAPTLYVYKVDQLMATARSNKVAVVLGLQELPQFKKQYGKDSADTTISVFGNLFSGQARHKDTLDWLEASFGKKKQLNESVSLNRRDTSVTLSEKYESVIPRGKISKLETGEIVGIYAKNINEKIDYKKHDKKKDIPTMVNCRINLDMDDIERENQNMREIPKAREFSGEKNLDQFLIANMIKIREDIQNMYKKIKSSTDKTE